MTVSRGAQSILPAALVTLGLLLQGCGERQETPVGPPSPTGTEEAALNRWSTRASMPTARSGLGVGVINDLVYAVAGRRNSTTIAATNERFTP